MDNDSTAQSAPPVQAPINTTQADISSQSLPSAVAGKSDFPPPYTSRAPSTSRKKYLLAAVAVTFLVVAAGAGSYFLQGFSTKVTPQAATKITQAPVQAAVTTAPKILELLVDSPTGEMVTKSGKVTVSGKTEPNTTVVFYNDIDQNSVESDNSGHFAGTIALAPGINPLVVSAFTDQGEQKTLNLNLVYDNQI